MGNMLKPGIGRLAWALLVLILLLAAVPVGYFLWKPKPQPRLVDAGCLESKNGLIMAMTFAFSPDGRKLATVSDSNGIVQLWDMRARLEIFKWTVKSGSVSSVAFSPDSKLLVAGCPENGVGKTSTWVGGRVLDVASRREVRHLKGSWPFVSVAFSPDGRFLAVNEYEGVALIEMKSRRRTALRGAYPACVPAAAFASNGKTLMIGTMEHAELLDCASGQTVRNFDAYFPDVAVSADRRLLAGAPLVSSFRKKLARYLDKRPFPYCSYRADVTDNSATVQIWDISTGRKIRRMDSLFGEYVEFAFSPDGQLLAGLCKNKPTSTSIPEYTLQLWDVKSGRRLQLISLAGLSSLTFSPDGKLLAGAMPDGTIRLWEVIR